MIQPDHLRAIMSTIEQTDFQNVGSITLLMEYGFKLQQWGAFSGQQMAEMKQVLHNSRRQAMINLMASMKANGVNLAATLQRDYINDLCAVENAQYELAERCNRVCVHAADLVRTCLSTLKEEMKMTL